MTVLAHAGAIYALIDRSDAWHALIRSWWQLSRERVVVPAFVVPSVSRALAQRLGPDAEAALARAVRLRELVVEPSEGADLVRAAELSQQPGATITFEDASLVAMAERIGALAILTTERGRFAGVKPHHVEALRLLP